MQRWIVGLTCLSILGYSIPVIDTTPVTSFGSVISLRPNGEKHAEFGEGIRDWFRNVKNRVLGGTNDYQVPVETGKVMMELENEDLQDRKNNSPRANLSFDPKNDWGFRLGQWYFIRRSDEAIIDDWKSSPTYPEWPMEEGHVNNAIPPLIIMRPNNDPTTVVTTITSEETSEISETEIPDVQNSEENRNSKEDNRSTEVLLPSK